MSDIRFSQLSPSELKKMKLAQDQIKNAQQDMADVVMKHLHITPLAEDAKAKAMHAKEQEKTFIPIYDGCCKVVGVYVDPPGVCAAV